MSTETRTSIEEFEAQVKATTIAKHEEEISLIENLLNQYLAGFRKIDKFTPSKDNKLEYAWLLLTTRSFNSLRCAFDLLQKGYYSQAMMLIRAVDEDWLICRDCEKNQKTLNALLKGSGRLRKNDLRYSEMAKRISHEFYDKVWAANYGQESEIAHASQMALKILIEPATNNLLLGGGYLDVLLIPTCHALLRSAVGMTEFLIKLLGENALQWQRESFAAFQAACAYVERISEEARTTGKKEKQ